MKKVFLYLYPIKEFTDRFVYTDKKVYEELNIENPLPILNEAIDRRYRKKGYQVVFALYPDKELYGLEQKDEDKIIYADIPFSEASGVDEKGNKKETFTPRYPSEEYLIDKLGQIDELIVGGYHATDCVKRVAEAALQRGIKSLVDVDLTDVFFNVCRDKEYFNMEEFNPESFRKYIINSFGEGLEDIGVEVYRNTYSSPVYGTDIDSDIIL